MCPHTRYYLVYSALQRLESPIYTPKSEDMDQERTKITSLGLNIPIHNAIQRPTLQPPSTTNTERSLHQNSAPSLQPPPKSTALPIAGSHIVSSGTTASSQPISTQPTHTGVFPTRFHGSITSNEEYIGGGGDVNAWTPSPLPALSNASTFPVLPRHDNVITSSPSSSLFTSQQSQLAFPKASAFGPKAPTLIGDKRIYNLSVINHINALNSVPISQVHYGMPTTVARNLDEERIGKQSHQFSGTGADPATRTFSQSRHNSNNPTANGLNRMPSSEKSSDGTFYPSSNVPASNGSLSRQPSLQHDIGLDFRRHSSSSSSSPGSQALKPPSMNIPASAYDLHTSGKTSSNNTNSMYNSSIFVHDTMLRPPPTASQLLRTSRLPDPEKPGPGNLSRHASSSGEEGASSPNSLSRQQSHNFKDSFSLKPSSPRMGPTPSSLAPSLSKQSLSRTRTPSLNDANFRQLSLNPSAFNPTVPQARPTSGHSSPNQEGSPNRPMNTIIAHKLWLAQGKRDNNNNINALLSDGMASIRTVPLSMLPPPPDASFVVQILRLLNKLGELIADPSLDHFLKKMDFSLLQWTNLYKTQRMDDVEMEQALEMLKSQLSGKGASGWVRNPKREFPDDDLTPESSPIPRKKSISGNSGGANFPKRSSITSTTTNIANNSVTVASDVEDVLSTSDDEWSDEIAGDTEDEDAKKNDTKDSEKSDTDAGNTLSESVIPPRVYDIQHRRMDLEYRRSLQRQQWKLDQRQEQAANNQYIAVNVNPDMSSNGFKAAQPTSARSRPESSYNSDNNNEMASRLGSPTNAYSDTTNRIASPQPNVASRRASVANFKTGTTTESDAGTGANSGTGIQARTRVDIVSDTTSLLNELVKRFMLHYNGKRLSKIWRDPQLYEETSFTSRALDKMLAGGQELIKVTQDRVKEMTAVLKNKDPRVYRINGKSDGNDPNSLISSSTGANYKAPGSISRKGSVASTRNINRRSSTALHLNGMGRNSQNTIVLTPMNAPPTPSTRHDDNNDNNEDNGNSDNDSGNNDSLKVPGGVNITTSGPDDNTVNSIQISLSGKNPSPQKKQYKNPELDNISDWRCPTIPPLALKDLYKLCIADIHKFDLDCSLYHNNVRNGLITQYKLGNVEVKSTNRFRRRSTVGNVNSKNTVVDIDSGGSSPTEPNNTLGSKKNVANGGPKLRIGSGPNNNDDNNAESNNPEKARLMRRGSDVKQTSLLGLQLYTRSIDALTSLGNVDNFYNEDNNHFYKGNDGAEKTSDNASKKRSGKTDLRSSSVASNPDSQNPSSGNTLQISIQETENPGSKPQSSVSSPKNVSFSPQLSPKHQSKPSKQKSGSSSPRKTSKSPKSQPLSPKRPQPLSQERLKLLSTPRNRQNNDSFKNKETARLNQTVKADANGKNPTQASSGKMTVTMENPDNGTDDHSEETSFRNSHHLRVDLLLDSDEDDSSDHDSRNATDNEESQENVSRLPPVTVPSPILLLLRALSLPYTSITPSSELYFSTTAYISPLLLDKYRRYQRSAYTHAQIAAYVAFVCDPPQFMRQTHAASNSNVSSTMSAVDTAKWNAGYGSRMHNANDKVKKKIVSLVRADSSVESEEESDGEGVWTGNRVGNYEGVKHYVKSLILRHCPPVDYVNIAKGGHNSDETGLSNALPGEAEADFTFDANAVVENLFRDPRHPNNDDNHSGKTPRVEKSSLGNESVTSLSSLRDRQLDARHLWRDTILIGHPRLHLSTMALDNGNNNKKNPYNTSNRSGNGAVGLEGAEWQAVKSAWEECQLWLSGTALEHNDNTITPYMWRHMTTDWQQNDIDLSMRMLNTLAAVVYARGRQLLRKKDNIQAPTDAKQVPKLNHITDAQMQMSIDGPTTPTLPPASFSRNTSNSQASSLSGSAVTTSAPTPLLVLPNSAYTGAQTLTNITHTKNWPPPATLLSSYLSTPQTLPTPPLSPSVPYTPFSPILLSPIFTPKRFQFRLLSWMKPSLPQLYVLHCYLRVLNEKIYAARVITSQYLSGALTLLSALSVAALLSPEHETSHKKSNSTDGSEGDGNEKNKKSGKGLLSGNSDDSKEDPATLTTDSTSARAIYKTVQQQLIQFAGHYCGPGLSLISELLSLEPTLFIQNIRPRSLQGIELGIHWSNMRMLVRETDALAKVFQACDVFVLPKAMQAHR